MPSLRACWRNAPTVRFICFEILATGVLAFECLRNSACSFFVHSTRVRFFAFLANSMLLISESRVLYHTKPPVQWLSSRQNGRAPPSRRRYTSDAFNLFVKQRGTADDEPEASIRQILK